MARLHAQIQNCNTVDLADGLQLLCLHSNCYRMPMRQLLMSCQPGSSQDVDLGGVSPIIDLMASYELIEVRRRHHML